MTMESLPAPLAQAIAARGYEELTPVQSAVIADEARGRDLLVSAQTGSGKTVAFGLAMADELLGGGEVLPPAGRPLARATAEAPPPGPAAAAAVTCPARSIRHHRC